MNATSERFFFAASAIWYSIVVFWGFAPSFYLSRFLEDPDPLPLHLVIHGIVFTTWIILYVIQVVSIRKQNVQLHKALGILGLVVIILMVPTGIFPSIYKFYVGTTTIDAAGHNVFRLGSGYLLFALAFIYRKKPFIHKRLMLGCMVMLMSAAIFRISFDLGLEGSQVFNKGMQVLPAFVLFLFDLVKLNKVVWVDLISVAMVFCIYFLADFFWLSTVGTALMEALIFVFVLPFV